MISSGMVLQRDTELKLWGWGSAGEKVNLLFKDKTYTAIADSKGQWMIKLPPQQKGGPFSMTFKGGNEIKLDDILFGDVWLCGGQSNMELTLERVKNKYASILAQVNNPQIRQFEIPDKYDFKQPLDEVSGGNWIQAKGSELLRFSAVAYFFAAEINRLHKVPVGLINSALGGSPAEAWISEASLKSFPPYYSEVQDLKKEGFIKAIEDKDQATQNAWYHRAAQTDPGLHNQWAKQTYVMEDWKEFSIPGYWYPSKGKPSHGTFWLRKEVSLSADWISGSSEILLGRIVDADSVFINGFFIGTTTYQYPPRRYSIPKGILKEGKNVIVIRVVNHAGMGGFVPEKEYELRNGDKVVDLKGTWKIKQGAVLEELPSPTFIRWKPVGLFNAMVAPLFNYSLKGVIWYQGESNTKNPDEYLSLMKTLISDWRKGWNIEALPFLFVQLAGFMEEDSIPVESSWAALRQAQLNTLSVPHTAMAVAADLGEWNDIHPLNKKDVGERLALQARQMVYGEKSLVSSGPIFHSLRKKGSKLIIDFKSSGKGLTSCDGKELKYFAVAGEDGKYKWAKAMIEGTTVVVWNDSIKNPISVRYGWANNPVGANLCNREGLPSSPFEARIKREKK